MILRLFFVFIYLFSLLRFSHHPLTILSPFWLHEHKMALSVKTFNSDSILNIVDSLRADGTSASFCFNTAEHPLSGKQCLIYAVKFPDDATWAVRIPAHTSHLPQEAITDYLKTEISILKNLETRGFSWSPRLLGYDCGFNNPLEFPYLVLSWIEGKPLEWSDTVPSQRENRNKILHQLANIILEMAESTKESCKCKSSS